MYFELLRQHLNLRNTTALAYGSGVFNQSGNVGNKMIDFLVVVPDADLPGWHEENMRVNPLDYPKLARLTLRSPFKNHFTNSVYYVPSVRVPSGQVIKYGVVGWDTLQRDLYTWNSVFLAGRLHKPTLKFNETELLRKAMEYNFNAALNTAVLLSTFAGTGRLDFLKILEKIVSLSYTADPRLLLAESPQKIQNILTGQLRELEEIYLERWEGLEGRIGKCFHDPLVRLSLLIELPFALKTEILANGTRQSLWSLALSNECDRRIVEALGRIVRRSAWRQMLLGAISTPPLKSLNYVLAKVGKRFM